MKGLFVVGTDTGVGKTLVAAGLARILVNRGVRVGVFKPVASGCGIMKHGGFSSDDGRRLCQGARLKTEWEKWVVPVRYRRPLSPWVAGWTEGKVDLRKIESARRFMEMSFECLVVEGVGGVHAPITEKVWISDLAQKWKYPVLVVARAGLGTLNHTLLTLEALRHRKIQILGVLVNGAKGKDGSEKTNILALRRLAGVSVFGPVRWNPCYRQDLDDLARVLDALGILPNRRKKT